MSMKRLEMSPLSKPLHSISVQTRSAHHVRVQIDDRLDRGESWPMNLCASFGHSLRSIWLPGKHILVRTLAMACVCGAIVGVGTSELHAQQPKSKTDVQKQKASENSKSDPAAVNFYADAANFQNNGAFELAVEEWQKLLKEYPKDPLASKASHYLGVCFMQQAKPNYGAAADAFARALSDKKLDIRDESLINLGWCQFMQGRASEQDGKAQEKLFAQARSTLSDYIKEYPQGSSVDQALFFTGEIEYSLGNSKKAIEYYEQLLKAKSLANSSWRADATYALGVSQEQLKQLAEAKATYEKFLADNPSHRLSSKVSVRLADLLLRENNAAEAEKLLRKVADNVDNALADYALLRLGQALAEQEKTKPAIELFEQLIEKFPKSEYVTTAKLSAGQMYFREGRYPEAAERFREVLKQKNTQGAEAAHLLAMTLNRTPQAADAIPLLQDTLKWASKMPAALQLRMDLAEAYYSDPQHIEDARQEFEKIATEFPDDPLAPRAAYNTAFASLQLGKLEDARRWSETFLKKYPQDPLRADVAYVASETMLQQGQHAAAIEGYSKLINSEKDNPARPFWKLRLAMAHFLAGKYEDAIKVLDAAETNFTEPAQKAEALSIIGSSYLQMDNPTAALTAFENSRKTSDKWVRADEVLLLMSQVYQRQNNAQKAIATLEELISKYPKSRMRYQARYRIGQIHAANDEFDKAIADYRAILGDPAAASLHDYARYGEGRLLIKQDKYEEALKVLKPLIDAKRTDSLGSETLVAQSLSLRKLGRVDDAINALNQFIDSKPTGMLLANGLYELGMAYVQKEQPDKAIASFERVLKEVPDYPAKDKILFELGWAWTDKEENEKAAQRFQELVDQYPQSEFLAESLYQLAQQHFIAKRYEKAAPIYTTAISKASDTDLKEKAMYKLGWSLYQQNQYDAAAKQFRQEAQEFPKGSYIVDAHFMVGECLFKQDKFAEAFSNYQKARTLFENNEQKEVTEQVRSLIYLHGAQCLREQKKWNDSEMWLREVIKRYPDSPYLSTVIFELATTKQNQNQTDEALRLFGEVASKYRDEIAARARYMMGELYFAQRQFEKAIPEFQRVMFGYGAEKADDSTKNWQARGGFEAGRCSEVLIQDLKGEARTKAINYAKEFYQYVLDKHPTHEVVKQAQARLNELNKLR